MTPTQLQASSAQRIMYRQAPSYQIGACLKYSTRFTILPLVSMVFQHGFFEVVLRFLRNLLPPWWNLSISSSVVPTQWKTASILPIAKVQPPTTLSDFRPISITPVLSRILERIVVHDYIYPSLQCPPSALSFKDQFAFQPTGSTTCAHHPHSFQSFLNPIHMSLSLH